MMDSYVIKLSSQEDLKDPEKMRAFQKAMNQAQEEMNDYIQEEAFRLGIPESWAMSVVYLRTRSRHTPELEAELIRMAKAGDPGVNMNEWPDSETLQRLKVRL